MLHIYWAQMSGISKSARWPVIVNQEILKCSLHFTKSLKSIQFHSFQIWPELFDLVTTYCIALHTDVKLQWRIQWTLLTIIPTLMFCSKNLLNQKSSPMPIFNGVWKSSFMFSFISSFIFHPVIQFATFYTNIFLWLQGSFNNRFPEIWVAPWPTESGPKSNGFLFTHFVLKTPSVWIIEVTQLMTIHCGGDLVT